MGTIRGFLSILCSVVLALVLTACGPGNTKQTSPQAAQSAPAETGSQGDPRSQTKASGASAPRVSPAESARAKIEKKLLIKAQAAFRSGRLTQPEHDNAYDSFQSVLILNPSNGQARSGVQAILLRYAELARNGIRDGQLATAASLLRQAELYYPANPLLLDLKRELAREREREEETLLSNAPENITIMEYPLPSGALSRKSSTISAYLSRIAERVQESDESVMIYARSDAEGRWIYGQLKKAVPGYRVRGDIRISRKPKISVLPPLQ